MGHGDMQEFNSSFPAIFILHIIIKFSKSHMDTGTINNDNGAHPLTGWQPTARGFEPLRAEPNGFLVHHLSHSVTLSLQMRLNFMRLCHRTTYFSLNIAHLWQVAGVTVAAYDPPATGRLLTIVFVEYG